MIQGSMQFTLFSCIATAMALQFSQCSVDEAARLHRLYDSLPLRRSEVVLARWIEGAALILIFAVLGSLVAALTGAWASLIIPMIVMCLSVAVGVPVFLCQDPGAAWWTWAGALAVILGGAYGGVPLLITAAGRSLPGVVAALMTVFLCAMAMAASGVVARFWYGHQNH